MNDDPFSHEPEPQPSLLVAGGAVPHRPVLGAPAPRWDGTRDLTGPELQRLVGRGRHTLIADQKAKLLAKPERRERVKAKVFKAADVRRYLKHKFPSLLP